MAADNAIQEAVKYIGLELRDHPETDKAKLIEEASRRFDLNPLQTEFLINKFLLGK